jgi:CHAT domain-containing protein
MSALNLTDSVDLGMNRFLFALFLLFSYSGYSQKFADKEFYLVDSLVYDSISPTYQYMVDWYLDYYHKATDDLTRVSAVYEIVRNCYDENVWPLYNEWVFNFTKKKMEESLPDSLHFIYDQVNIGTIYYRGWGYYYKTDYENSIATFMQCYERYAAIEDARGMANSLDNVGSVYSTKGDPAIALEYHEQGLAIREKIQDTLGLGASWNAIGIIHMSHGDYKRAAKEFKKSIAYHTAVGFQSGLSSAYSNLGGVFLSLGQLERSLEYHLKSYRIKESLEDKQGMAITLYNLSSICLLMGDTASAVTYTNYSLEYAQEIGDQKGIAGAKSYLGYIHFLQDEYEEGATLCNEALNIAINVGSQPEKGSALKRLYLGYLWWGKYSEAEIYLNQLVDKLRKDIKVNFAILPEQKKELYFKTMTIEFENLYAFGNFVKDENPDITMSIYDNTLLLKGLLLQSTTAMRSAILSSNNNELIVLYNQWIVLKTEIADAYAKGLSTADLEKGANILEQELVTKSAAFDEFQTGKTITWKDVQSNLEKTEVAIEFIRFPEVTGLDSADIIYSALIVRSDSKRPEMINLCTEDELEQVLGTVVANNIHFVQEVYGTMEDTDQELSKLIWEPLKKSLKGIEKIYYASDGLLHKVAFSAIRIEADKFMSDQFELVQVGSTAALMSKEKYVFGSNTVATLFGGVQYNSDSSKHEIWKYLPGSLKETEAIKGIISKDMKVNYYSGLDASEEHFKKSVSESNILHIASHGFFYPDPNVLREETTVENETETGELKFRSGSTSNYGVWNFVNNENPLMRSGLAMAGANDAWQRSVFAEGEDGVLSAQEVSNLNMSKTELVVLSACETGLGDIKGNEGVYGLQRAFKMAGVHYIIMSLWQVPDAETAEFMTLFYGKLFELKDIRAAFKEAQAVMRVKYDPYFWAAFVLIE